MNVKVVSVSDMILDVGCGVNPKGDINCDLGIYSISEHGIKRKDGLFIDPKKIKNFVRCDAHYLPFSDNSFELVYSSHLIEHLHNPIQFIRECIRVSKNNILITCPHRCNFKARRFGHKHFFNKAWFTTALRTMFYTIRVINHPLLWFLPSEIEVSIVKTSETV